jgi:excisionase family DNA binding protein
MKAFDTLQIPGERDTELAKNALETLANIQGDLTLKLADKTLTLPASILKLLETTFEEFAQGRAVGIVSYETAISVFETAEILNVSTDFVEKLLGSGQLPFEEKRSSRKIPLKDVLEYKRVTRARQEEAMRELTQLSQEMGLYDELPLHLQSKKTK